jgi:hypothetical protein
MCNLFKSIKKSGRFVGAVFYMSFYLLHYIDRAFGFLRLQSITSKLQSQLRNAANPITQRSLILKSRLHNPKDLAALAF